MMFLRICSRVYIELVWTWSMVAWRNSNMAM